MEQTIYLSDYYKDLTKNQQITFSIPEDILKIMVEYDYHITINFTNHKISLDEYCPLDEEFFNPDTIEKLSYYKKQIINHIKQNLTLIFPNYDIK